MIIWGTGNVCKHLLQSNPDMNPEFYIDNDFDKADSFMYNIIIKHPSQIAEWKDFYIVVALDNYLSVKVQLEELGLKEGESFIWYRDFLFQKSLLEMQKEAECFCDILKEQTSICKGKSIIVSDFLAFDKGVCDYINNRKECGLDAVLLSEAYWVSESYAEKKMKIPVYKLPAFLAHNQYIKEDVTVEKVVIDYVQSKKYLSEASRNLRMGYPKMATNYEYLVCFWADKIMRTVMEYWKPKSVILWNAFYAFHKIIRGICEEEKIFVKYMEFGNIPGTIQEETIGQMGESYPSKFPEEFIKIDVSEEELCRAEALVEELYRKRTNRNIQPKSIQLDEIKENLQENKPVVFYVGQNDNAAGFQPYTENSKKYHSPIFESSDEAAVYLAKLCKKNNWNYIYKPHPMMMENFRPEVMPDNTIVVNQMDINELIDFSDVVITIVSTVSYIALIRNKPVLMLGYTQLKSKGCTYESFEEKHIEEQIKSALSEGYSEEKRKHFLKHVVQMGKYYSQEGGKKDECSRIWFKEGAKE